MASRNIGHITVELPEFEERVFDLAHLYQAEEQTRRWKAENENASARLELAQIRERCARLMSQAEPVNSLGIDRDVLRKVVKHLLHNEKLP